MCGCLRSKPSLFMAVAKQAANETGALGPERLAIDGDTAKPRPFTFDKPGGELTRLRAGGKIADNGGKDNQGAATSGGTP